MNVFDEEMGPLTPQSELLPVIALCEAGLTLEEYRAWKKLRGRRDQLMRFRANR